MKRITPPGFKDQSIANAICADRGWGAQRPLWAANYAAYRVARGNPKALARTAIAPDIADELYNLYGSVRGKEIGDIVRHDMAVGACPVCGSDGTGTVDHFFPRRSYEEFSIFGPNLVPACANCNMFAKRGAHMGSGPDDFLLHPYYDDRLKKPVWRVGFVGPLAAVTFAPMPLPTLGPKLTRRVRYHLSVVLKREFHKSMENLWPAHQEAVADEARFQGLGAVTVGFLIAETERQLRYSAPKGNHNSWRSAFYRGLLADPAALAFAANAASAKV